MSARIPHADAVNLGKRAWAIVERLYPDATISPHGWYQREAFIEVCQYRAARNALYRRIFWRLAEKAAQHEQFTEVQSDPFKGRFAA